MGESVGHDSVGANAPFRLRRAWTGRGRLNEDVALARHTQHLKGALHLRTQALRIAGGAKDVVAGANLVDGRDTPLMKQMMVPKTVTCLRLHDRGCNIALGYEGKHSDRPKTPHARGWR